LLSVAGNHRHGQHRVSGGLKTHLFADAEIQHGGVRAHLVEKPQAGHHTVVRVDQLVVSNGMDAPTR